MTQTKKYREHKFGNKNRRATQTISLVTSHGAPIITSSTYRHASTLRLLSCRFIIGWWGPLFALSEEKDRTYVNNPANVMTSSKIMKSFRQFFMFVIHPSDATKLCLKIAYSILKNTGLCFNFRWARKTPTCMKMQQRFEERRLGKY